LAILLRLPAVANADEQRRHFLEPQKDTAREDEPLAVRSGM
jgi:hypothetical protein